MQAVAGTDRSRWHDRVGLFGPESPLANDAGIEVMTTPRDYAAVRKALADAGYKGERIVAIDVADIPVLHAVSLVGLNELVQSGMNVDIQTIDFGTAVRRRSSNQPPDQGGWNVFCTLFDGTLNFTPGGNAWVRGNGEWIGWPKSAQAGRALSGMARCARPGSRTEGLSRTATATLARRAIHSDGTVF